jgi:hypothetical protein
MRCHPSERGVFCTLVSGLRYVT